MKKLLPILLMFQLSFAKGQNKEYIGIINPSTGTDSIINRIYGDSLIYVGVSTFNDNNHRFIFYGIDSAGNKLLYCINAITGAILSQATFTLNSGEFQYDNTSNTLYGLYNSLGRTFLASIDINTASTSIIDTLPFSGYMGGSTFFDEANHTYVIRSSGSFYSINVNTHSITTTPAPTTYELQFDNTTGTPYGLVMAGTSMYLAKINVSNGTYNTIASLPSGYNSTTFNNNNHTYTFSQSTNLYSINVNTGVVSSTVFPVGISTMSNFELQYDNSSSILYAIQFGTYNAAGIKEIKASGGALIYQNAPNPFGDGTMIKYYVPEGTTNAQVIFYDEFGNQLKTFSVVETGAGQLNITSANLAPGTYSYSLLINGKAVDTKKMVKTN